MCAAACLPTMRTSRRSSCWELPAEGRDIDLFAGLPPELLWIVLQYVKADAKLGQCGSRRSQLGLWFLRPTPLSNCCLPAVVLAEWEMRENELQVFHRWDMYNRGATMSRRSVTEAWRAHRCAKRARAKALESQYEVAVRRAGKAATREHNAYKAEEAHRSSSWPRSTKVYAHRDYVSLAHKASQEAAYLATRVSNLAAEWSRAESEAAMCSHICDLTEIEFADGSDTEDDEVDYSWIGDVDYRFGGVQPHQLQYYPPQVELYGDEDFLRPAV